MLDELLIILQILIWLVLTWKLWLNNRFYALFSCSIFLYILPTEIVYRFFPSFVNYYWGGDIWYNFYFFSSLSLFSLLFLLNFDKKKLRINAIFQKKTNSTFTIRVFMLCYFALCLFLFYINFDKISYYSLVMNGIENTADTSLSVTTFLIKNLPYLLILPVIASNNKNKTEKFICLLAVILFVIFCFMGGSRSGLLSLCLSIFAYWIYGKQIKLKQVCYILFFAFLFLYVSSEIAKYRKNGVVEDVPLVEKILDQDYTIPAYNIIAVQAKSYIDPIAVIESNVLRMFPALGGEPLYEYVGKRVFTNSGINATQGLGFHPFVEGFMFAGIFGFIYNAIVLFFWLYLWNRFMSTNNEQFNRLMFAVMIGLFFAIVRSQALYFFRYIYITIIPASYIYSKLSGVSIRYKKFICKN